MSNIGYSAEHLRGLFVTSAGLRRGAEAVTADGSAMAWASVGDAPCAVRATLRWWREFRTDPRPARGMVADAVIPISILVGLIAGIGIRRPLVLLSTVLALGIGWVRSSD